MSPNVFALVDGDGEVVGIYSTLTLASQAMERVPCCAIEARELDKLPDEPEGHREPDYGAPSAAERLERDSFDADRETHNRDPKPDSGDDPRWQGPEYDKYEHREFLGGER